MAWRVLLRQPAKLPSLHVLVLRGFPQRRFRSLRPGTCSKSDRLRVKRPSLFSTAVAAMRASVRRSPVSRQIRPARSATPRPTWISLKAASNARLGDIGSARSWPHLQAASVGSPIDDSPGMADSSFFRPKSKHAPCHTAEARDTPSLAPSSVVAQPGCRGVATPSHRGTSRWPRRRRPRAG